MAFRIERAKGTSKSLDFLRQEFPKRVQALERIVARRSAQQVRDAVAAPLPTSPPLVAAYKESLEVVDVTGEPSAAAITGVVERDLKNVDATTTLVSFPLFESQRDLGAAVLRTFEPWAIAQLPPILVKQPAVLRTAAPAMVASVAQINAADRKDVDELLKQAEVPFQDEFELKGVAFHDVEHLGLQIEFGMDGAPIRKPHWKPALDKAKRGQFAKELAANADFQELATRTLTDPGFAGWKQEVKPLEGEVSGSTADGFEDFGKTVG